MVVNMERILLAGYLLVGLLLSGGYANPLEVKLRVRRGDSVILPCRLSSDLEPDMVSVRWNSSKDSLLTSGTRVLKYANQIEVVKTSKLEWNLLIKSVKDTFGANYTCTTDQQVVLSNVQLLILVDPKIDCGGTNSSDVSVDEGGTVHLSCAFTGEPVANITWFRGDYKKPIGITGSKLVLPNITRHATDVYTCRGENSVSSEDYTINLIVKFPVEVDVMEKTLYVKKGGVSTLACIAQGEPLDETYWIDVHGNKVMSTTWQYDFNIEPAGAHIPAKFVTLATRKGTLTVFDFGPYTCEANGDGRVANAIVNVVELKEPN
ncbi:LSAMP-like protein [Mya arenaria]|uniref:LSAMP-like protein n=1 Tax=Mya arenaria TaxID=6604 RepID=A0ABY7EG56_MYAAR|nr:protein CEPU-1-like [Mya arenaria]WAR08988.1 LSAMP-like protein [Mya arenaria]